MDQHTHLTSEKSSTCSSLSFDKCTIGGGGGGGGGRITVRKVRSIVSFSLTARA